jgi:hypothetical protein
MINVTQVMTTGFQQVENSIQRSEAAVISSLRSELAQSVDAITSTLRDNRGQNDIVAERADEIQDIVCRMEAVVIQETQDQPAKSEIMSEIQHLRTNLNQHIQQVGCRNDGLETQVSKMQSTLDQLCGMASGNVQSMRARERLLGALVADEVSTASRAQASSAHQKRSVDNQSTFVSVQATLSTGRRCKASCNCQCHKSTSVGTPGVLSGMLGSLFLRWSAIPLFRPRICDHPRCGNNANQTIRLTYMFPSWMLQRAFSVSLSWDGLTGMGADIHLALPQVISDQHGIWTAVAKDDTSWIRAAVTDKRLSLTEVSPGGESLLMVRRLAASLQSTGSEAVC